MFSIFAFALLTTIPSDCDARRDPFCSDLEDAPRIEREWLALDAAISAPQSFREGCIPGAAHTIRAARAAAAQKAAAYRRYYQHWVTLAQNSSQALSQGVARQADSRRAIERLLADAEADYANLLQKASSLPQNNFPPRPLTELIRQARLRIANLREALSRWSDDRKSTRDAAVASRIIRDRMQDAIRSVSVESILWDAYYDGIATWNTLRCGGPRQPAGAQAASSEDSNSRPQPLN